MRRALEFYQYAGPAILTPLSLWLWWRHFGAWPPALVAWAVPISWAYVVPAVGTNVLKVWEFDVRYKLGRFRPHHGFVFGSASSMLALAVQGPPVTDLYGVIRSAVVLACVLGYVNLIYDIEAIECGLIKVYNQPWADGREASAIAMDYAPWFFGGFGACYGAGLALLEWSSTCHGDLSQQMVAPVILGFLLVSILIPVGGYVIRSKRRHGHWGVMPVARI